MLDRKSVIVETAQGISHLLGTESNPSPESTLREVGATMDVEVLSVPIKVLSVLCNKFGVERSHELERAYCDALEEQTQANMPMSRTGETRDRTLTIEQVAECFMTACQAACLTTSNNSALH